MVHKIKRGKPGLPLDLPLPSSSMLKQFNYRPDVIFSRVHSDGNSEHHDESVGFWVLHAATHPRPSVLRHLHRRPAFQNRRGNDPATRAGWADILIRVYSLGSSDMFILFSVFLFNVCLLAIILLMWEGCILLLFSAGHKLKE